MSVSVQKLATGAGVQAAGAGAAWASEANARDGTAASPDNNTYATSTPAKSTFNGSVWPFAFTVGDIPDNATVLSMLVEIQWKLAAATTTYSLDASCYANANETTPLSAVPGVSHASGPTVDTTESFSLTTLPTVAQLRAGIYVRVKNIRGTSNTATAASLDFIRVTVTYSVPTVTNITVGAAMTVAPAAVEQRTAVKTIAAAMVETPANARVTGRSQPLAVTASAVVQRMQPRALPLTFSASPALQVARKLHQALAASTALSSALAFQRVHMTPLAVSVSLNPVPAMQRLVTRALAASIVDSLAQGKMMPRTLAVTTTLAPTAIEKKTLYISVPAAMTLAPISTRRQTLHLTANALTSLASSMLRSVLRKVNAQELQVVIVNRQVGVPLHGGVVLGSNMNAIKGPRLVQIALAAQMALAAASTRLRTAKRALAVTGSVSPVAVTKLTAKRALPAVVTLDSVFTKTSLNAPATTMTLDSSVQTMQQKNMILSVITSLAANVSLFVISAAAPTYNWLKSVVGVPNRVTGVVEAEIEVTSLADGRETRMTGAEEV